MGWLRRQQEMKLDILESLARSQRAMARIMESAASMSEGEQGQPVDKDLRKSMEAIERYQLAIMDKMLGIRVREVHVSPPAVPWTNEQLRVCSSYDPKPQPKPEQDLEQENKETPAP
ncbi:hypothetical protein D7M11_09655 [Paenibacillus ginsengarvi]|uniref:Uncharacterized protein n=2 Tax=Paenibacillus ginsengarvi TaxID=400777 RepID=A0A3B0CM63_9BACL|nr:hypothetical protein D7M11_09655 [Paenibacillus ginsengarvi]